MNKLLSVKCNVVPVLNEAPELKAGCRTEVQLQAFITSMLDRAERLDIWSKTAA
jgi:hypothetical protein